jgi:hypothetical protein
MEICPDFYVIGSLWPERDGVGTSREALCVGGHNGKKSDRDCIGLCFRRITFRNYNISNTNITSFSLAFFFLKCLSILQLLGRSLSEEWWLVLTLQSSLYNVLAGI